MDFYLTRRNLIRLLGAAAGTFGLNKLGFAKTHTGFFNPVEDKDPLTEKVYFKKYKELKTLYDNPLKSKSDVDGFVMEGQADVSFAEGRMRMQNILDPSLKQKANFVYWCPETFPDNIAVSWDFWPVKEPGLCIMFFSAMGKNGEDIFDKNLNKRSGDYKQYHHGDINTHHVSYFRRNPKERGFQLSNLRKSYGHVIVTQGADPIPCVEFAEGPYQIRVVKTGPVVEFFINELSVFEWIDDGKTLGPVLAGGKIGFRQMAPLIADYANLKVVSVQRVK
ncbi:MAG: DUF1961 family protein [Melioribacteraceae bacterium]